MQRIVIVGVLWKFTLVKIVYQVVGLDKTRFFFKSQNPRKVGTLCKRNLPSKVAHHCLGWVVLISASFFYVQMRHFDNLTFSHLAKLCRMKIELAVMLVQWHYTTKYSIPYTSTVVFQFLKASSNFQFKQDFI